MNPEDLFGTDFDMQLGNSLLCIGRLGYRISFPAIETLEAGLTVRAPLGRPFREYAGVPMRLRGRDGSMSDFGGEPLVRLVSFYLRLSF